ncbi:MAG: hypothetical protein Q9200_004462 [Gallowayella weberi]
MSTSNFPVRAIPPWVRASAGSSDETPLPPNTSQWAAFVRANRIPVLPGEEGTIISNSEQRRRHPGDYAPWRGLSKRRPPKPLPQRIRERIHNELMVLPFVLFYLRLIIFICSAAALALTVVIIYKDRALSTNSAMLAMVIDALAVVYTPIITWDDIRGAPLGSQRRPTTLKLSIMIYDLLFIIFEIANVGLAFWHPFRLKGEEPGYRQAFIEQWASAAVLVVALVAWISIFTINSVK